MPPPAWHGQALRNLCDQSGVISLTHGRVEVDQLDQWKLGELFNPILKIIKGKAQFFALHELDDAAAQ